MGWVGLSAVRFGIGRAELGLVRIGLGWVGLGWVGSGEASMDSVEFG